MVFAVGNFLFSATNPFSGIRADLCVDIAVRLEHMLNVGVDVLIVTLRRVLIHIAALLDEAARTDLTLRRDWFLP